jgi:hypothetical protein
LIARAVEEAIAIIKPMGIMIFNMGGLPGQDICEHLFLRRGLHINKLWQTKIMQVKMLWKTILISQKTNLASIKLVFDQQYVLSCTTFGWV